MSEEKAALPTHKTDVDMNSAWDNGANKRRVKSPSTPDYFRRIYAYQNPNGDPKRKTSYTFIHHMVSADGNPGPANMRALSAGIAALNGSRLGTVLRGADRQGVYRHLASHYKDAGKDAPALMPESEVRAINEYIETKSESFGVGAQVSWLDDEGEKVGVVIEEESSVYLVREWKHDIDFHPTESFHQLIADEIEAKSFISQEVEESDIMEDADIKSIEFLAQVIAQAMTDAGVKVDGVMPAAPAAAPADDAGDTPLVAVLKVLLANEFSFYLQAHGAHWNVVGQDFSEYHGLFAEIYSDVYESIDPTAENLRKLGAEAPDTLEEYLQMRTVGTVDTEDTAEALAAGLLGSNMAMVAFLKNAFDVATQQNEQGIANFIAERIDMHEKWSWQLQSSLGVSTAPAAGQKDIDPPAGFSNARRDVEEPKEAAHEAAPVVEPVVESAPAAEAAQEAPAEAPAEAAQEAPVAEQQADENAAEAAPAEETEAKSYLTLQDLKEFQDLLRVL